MRGRKRSPDAVTNFSLHTADAERIIAALDPLAMKLGVRYGFRATEPE